MGILKMRGETENVWRFRGQQARAPLRGASKRNVVKRLDNKHYLEAFDSSHRYGGYLKNYHKRWLDSDCPDSFFDWLDEGDGQSLDLSDQGGVDRETLQKSTVEYCTKISRRKYVVVEKMMEVDERMCLQLSHLLGSEAIQAEAECDSELETIKMIFVLGSDDVLYMAKKVKGNFHHTSFFGARCIKLAGSVRLNEKGVVTEVNPYSGYYKPQKEEVERLLQRRWADLGVDLTTIHFVESPRKKRKIIIGNDDDLMADANTPIADDQQDQKCKLCHVVKACAVQ